MNNIPELKIEMVKLSEIKPYEKNAKKHPKKQVQAIAESIKAFGFLVPGVITQDGELIAGHGRHMAAKELELEAMPCIRAEHLSEEAIKAYRLLDPFSGSGSTLIAAEKTDRVCFGCELDLGFCDIIIQRYVDYTGNTKIIKNGKEEHWEISTANVSRVPELPEDVGTVTTP